MEELTGYEKEKIQEALDSNVWYTQEEMDKILKDMKKKYQKIAKDRKETKIIA